MKDRGKEKGTGDKVRKGGTKRSQDEEIQFRIDRMLNPQRYEDGIVPAWDTIKDDSEGTGLFTVEELVNMKPFRVEDLNTTIAFRANDKLWRAARRIMERSGGTYDIMSDLHRDIYMLGLIFMAQRYEDILGGDIILERARSRVQKQKEIEDSVRKLGEVLLQLPESDRNADYMAYMEFVRKLPYRLQTLYLSAMEKNALLAELRRRMVEAAKREES